MYLVAGFPTNVVGCSLHAVCAQHSVFSAVCIWRKNRARSSVLPAAAAEQPCTSRRCMRSMQAMTAQYCGCLGKPQRRVCPSRRVQASGVQASAVRVMPEPGCCRCLMVWGPFKAAELRCGPLARGWFCMCCRVAWLCFFRFTTMCEEWPAEQSCA